MPRLECRIAKFCLVKRLLSISAVQAAAWASGVTPAWPVQRCSSVPFAGCWAPAAVGDERRHRNGEHEWLQATEHLRILPLRSSPSHNLDVADHPIL